MLVAFGAKWHPTPLNCMVDEGGDGVQIPRVREYLPSEKGVHYKYLVLNYGKKMQKHP